MDCIQGLVSWVPWEGSYVLEELHTGQVALRVRKELEHQRPLVVEVQGGIESGLVVVVDIRAEEGMGYDLAVGSRHKVVVVEGEHREAVAILRRSFDLDMPFLICF